MNLNKLKKRKNIIELLLITTNAHLLRIITTLSHLLLVPLNINRYNNNKDINIHIYNKYITILTSSLSITLTITKIPWIPHFQTQNQIEHLLISIVIRSNYKKQRRQCKRYNEM